MEPLLPSKTAEKILGMKPGTLAVLRCRKSPHIPPHIKRGRSVKYDPAVLRQWIKDNTVGGETIP